MQLFVIYSTSSFYSAFQYFTKALSTSQKLWYEFVENCTFNRKRILVGERESEDGQPQREAMIRWSPESTKRLIDDDDDDDDGYDDGELQPMMIDEKHRAQFSGGLCIASLLMRRQRFRRVSAAAAGNHRTEGDGCREQDRVAATDPWNDRQTGKYTDVVSLWPRSNRTSKTTRE